MKEVNMVEKMRRQMVYEIEDQCENCGSYLFAWKQEERGKPFCEKCRAKEMNEEEERQRMEWTKNAYQTKALHRMKGSSLVKDKKIWDCSLKDYKVMDKETRQALKIAHTAVFDIIEGKTIHVIFSGVAGAGKTTLSLGLAKEVLRLDVNKHCMFLDYQYLLEELMASFNDKYLRKTIDKVMRDAFKADILVIDDLGAETSRVENRNQTASDFTVKQLNSILQARANMTTIVTTNLTGSQIKQAYGERITSRLFAHSQGYAMTFSETKDKRTNPLN